MGKITEYYKYLYCNPSDLKDMSLTFGYFTPTPESKKLRKKLKLWKIKK